MTEADKSKAGEPILAENVQVGDIVTACVIGWGTIRVKAEVTGVATGCTRPKNITPAFGIGRAIEDVRDGRQILVHEGEAVNLYWPDPNHPESETLGPRLLQRGDTPEPASTGDLGSELAELEKLLGQEPEKRGNLTLRNPASLLCDPAFDEYECDSCNTRAKWFYPKARTFKCGEHRDRSLQDANDPPHRHETYCAWRDDPTDAHHFA